ncbi:hypothetical protein [Mycoplasmopsis primatum]|uniref:hypothetical protein n=1 Tax=Mycoplasmopsis primatum TaxID=55604 RepID=UPI000494FFF4|nr:hypothetical protein [Mycoplasmopsis primatum]
MEDNILKEQTKKSAKLAFVFTLIMLLWAIFGILGSIPVIGLAIKLVRIIFGVLFFIFWIVALVFNFKTSLNARKVKPAIEGNCKVVFAMTLIWTLLWLVQFILGFVIVGMLLVNPALAIALGVISSLLPFIIQIVLLVFISKIRKNLEF